MNTNLSAFDAQADMERKLLRTHFRGIVTAENMRSGMESLEALLPSIGTGFVIIANLTDLEMMDLDCVPHLTRIMDLCLAAGVGRIVRVIPDPAKDIGFNLLSLTHYRGKVPITTYGNLAEAERAIGIAG